MQVPSEIRRLSLSTIPTARKAPMTTDYVDTLIQLMQTVDDGMLKSVPDDQLGVLITSAQQLQTLSFREAVNRKAPTTRELAGLYPFST